MIPKEFLFLAINTKSLWEEGSFENLDATEEGLSLHGEYRHIFGKKFSSDLPSLPAGFAVDDCGIIYVLDSEKNNVLIYDTKYYELSFTGCFEWLDCFGGSGKNPGKFCNPTAITLGSANLYIADNGNHRIQAFARSNQQVRWIVGPLEDSEGNALPKQIDPVNIVLDAQENLYVLDKANGLVHQFDKGGRLLQEFDIDTEYYELSFNASYLAVKDGFLYVLIPGNAILKFNIKTMEKTTISLDIDIAELSGLAVDKSGNIYVGGSNFLYKFDPSGKQIALITEFMGICKQISINEKGDLYILDGSTGEITLLTFVKRYSAKGVYISKVLDSAISELEWHKIVMDADIPEKTQVTVSYYISENESPPSDSGVIVHNIWSQHKVNPQDALISGNKGRYLWLKIEFLGDERQTPVIKSIRAYFPRLSYLRYLPGIYQEDPGSKDFLERFLSLFETFLFGTDEEISGITKYFDVNGTPSVPKPENDFLTWLASWFAAEFDESWSDAKKREFLAIAPYLYKKRGTREGLEEFIKIYTGKKPLIVEQFQIHCKEKENEEIWTKLFGDCLYCFCVLLNPYDVEYENGDLNSNISHIAGNIIELTNRLNTIRRIIEAEKPAHTSFGLKILQPWIYLNMHSYLGVNSILSQPIFRLGETSVISRDTVLTDTETGGQVERHSRVGADTTLT